MPVQHLNYFNVHEMKNSETHRQKLCGMRALSNPQRRTWEHKMQNSTLNLLFITLFYLEVMVQESIKKSVCNENVVCKPQTLELLSGCSKISQKTINNQGHKMIYEVVVSWAYFAWIHISRVEFPKIVFASLQEQHQIHLR